MIVSTKKNFDLKNKKTLSTPNDNNFKITSTIVTPPSMIKTLMNIAMKLLAILLYITCSTK